MAQADREHRVAGPRVSIGSPELDRMLEGGLMPRRPYLVVGPAGTGKTTLALQFLIEGIRRGERSLYVTVEDPPNEVLVNHRNLRPLLDKVDVFDAIPDVMRYEHTPFKDISAVRAVVPFASIPERIRQTPEFSSVEVTGTALEQILRSEVQKRGYSRLVIDSLTALQYFCMKGFDPTVGAQTFLRFLTDLRTTTVLTVEAPLEDVESPERQLARGEIRLFRWEYENSTVRAIGVEKFRGSSHDMRLHPYRIGPRGIDVQLEATISRDTRQLVAPALAVALGTEGPAAPPAPPIAYTEPLSDQVRDLVVLGLDLLPVRTEVEAALAAADGGRTDELRARMARLSAMVVSLAPAQALRADDPAELGTAVGQALLRVRARADKARSGAPPIHLPPTNALRGELESILMLVPAPAPAVPPAAAPAPERTTVAPPPVPPPVPEPTPRVQVEATSPAEVAALIASEPPVATILEVPPAPPPPPVPEMVEGGPPASAPAELPSAPSSEAAAPEPPLPERTPLAEPAPPPTPSTLLGARPAAPAPAPAAVPEVVSAPPHVTSPPTLPTAPTPHPYRGHARPAPPAVEMAEGGPPPPKPTVRPLPSLPPGEGVAHRPGRDVPSHRPLPAPSEPPRAPRPRATPPPPPPPHPTVPTIREGDEVPGTIPGEAPAPPTTPRTPRRRKSPAAKRVAPAAPAGEPVVGASALPSEDSGVVPSAPEPTAAPAVKPKRRAVRRKKAPTVVSAVPAGAPPEVPPAPTPAAETPPDPPSTEPSP